MSPEARRFALQAATKVAFLLPLAGCSEAASLGAADAVAEAEAATDAGDAKTSPYACGLGPWIPLPDAGDAATDGDVADAAPTDAGLDEAAAAAFACCVDVLEAALPTDSGVATYFDEERGKSPSVDRCCHYTLDYLDLKYDVDLIGFYEDRNRLGARGARYVCCTRYLSAACESWGPPAPPPTDSEEPARRGGEVLDLRAAARTRRPAFDPAPFSSAELLAARRTWRGRMGREHGSAPVFEALARQLRAAGCSEQDVRECLAFADEERTHGVLCGAVVEALGGEARLACTEPAEVMPEHPGVSREEALLRNLLSVSCLSETVAVALIAAERFDMAPGALRDLLTRIWSDEVGHARFGWRLVAEMAQGLDAATRARLGSYLVAALDHVEAHYCARIPLESRSVPSLGLCDGRAARWLVRDTLTRVVVPQLRALGLVPGELAA